MVYHRGLWLPSKCFQQRCENRNYLGVYKWLSFHVQEGGLLAPRREGARHRAPVGPAGCSRASSTGWGPSCVPEWTRARCSSATWNGAFVPESGTWG